MQIITIFLVSLLLSGCSVFMAAHSDGVDTNTLGACKTRSCFLAKGAVPVETKKGRNGNIVSETFQAQMPTGSAARAAMHGVLDVATLGLWEVAGTPIEGAKNQKQYYMLRVFYASDGETVKSIQLTG